jgi:hypothetical protein
MEEEKAEVNINKQNVEIRKQLEVTERFWNDSIDSLSKRLIEPVQKSTQLSAETISIRQILTEQIKSMSYNIFKFRQKVKVFEKERLEFYLLSYPVKTNSGEKYKMIEADLAAYQYRIDIFDVHVNFLRETVKNIDQINYSIKNKITLLQLTDME